ncbi:MAG TPA: GyrI-like domain-containing protein [Nevskia sp.]|nr:GyrI-like domain-containing protein [Nevskia sp.]
MLRNLILGLLLAVALFFTIGFVLPDKVHVQRTERIQAPPSQIFAAVNGFRQFDRWSPWAHKDPQMKVRISGPPLGVGAHYEWSGNKEVGSGSQEIVASTPYSQVKTRLMFAGFDRPSMATFDLDQNGEVTRVTWSLDVPLGSNPIAHYFGLLMDRQVGPDYERGLTELRGMTESGSKVDFAALQAQLVDVQPQTYAYVSGSTATDPAAIAKALAAAYAKVGAFMSASGLKQAAQPIAITRRWDPKANVYEFDAGIPVDKADATAPDMVKGKPGEVKIGHTYAGTALKAEHRGAYQDMGKTYALIDAYKTAYALQDNGLSWEQYVSDPGKTPQAQLLTDIYVPVK